MLAELGGRLFRDAFAADNRPEDTRAYLAEHFTPAALARILADPTCRVLVLEHGGRAVGWALLVTGTGAGVEIRRFYVEAPFQGSDASALLMRECLDRAAALGAGSVWLAVWERNWRAQAFYAKHGFRRVGAQPFQFGSDTQVDDLLRRPVSFGVSLAIVALGAAVVLRLRAGEDADPGPYLRRTAAAN